jgi:thiol-disulfide isomerase/thioredoxin
VKRQHVLGAIVGLGAAAAGLGGFLWRQSSTPIEPDASGGLWAMRFPRPEGGELEMAGLRGRPLVLNFWATWCPPCVKEMPELDRFHRAWAAAGWRVVGLAVDGPTPVREFLARTPVGYAIGLAGFEGIELGRRLGNERGALPFTVVFDAAGRIVQRKLGETHYDELVAWAKAL